MDQPQPRQENPNRCAFRTHLSATRCGWSFGHSRAPVQRQEAQFVFDLGIRHWVASIEEYWRASSNGAMLAAWLLPDLGPPRPRNDILRRIVG
jgi:hypothetical protein